jgi:hypothetical protein
MSDDRQSPHDKRFNAVLADALADARHSYRQQMLPPLLEVTVLAQMRAANASDAKSAAAHARVTGAMQPVATQHDPAQRVSLMLRLKTAWRQVLQTRWLPAMTGSLATVVVLAATAPWWLPLIRPTHEVATPFMLVSQPHAAQLDVAQMLRVNVTREAMLDFGLPVSPQQLSEPVKAEMLMGARGDVLAVRFIEPQPGKRWRWQMN